MPKKQIIKNVFDEEFNSLEMRKKILRKIERKELSHMNKYLKFVLPVCLIILVCSVIIVAPKNNVLENYQDKIIDNSENININVNKIDNLGAFLLDADIKTIPNNDLNIPGLEILKDIAIPSDLDELDGYSIYTRNDKTSKYDILNCYVYDYFENDTLRNIRIAFSDKEEPIRDYYFSKEGAKRSNINDYELTIYQYEKIYFTEFNYKGYYFDIETSDITLEELTLLLKSIIKK